MIKKLLPNFVKNININILAFVCVLLSLGLIICLIYTFVPQNLDVDFIKATFQLPVNMFVAEQAERASYIVSLLAVIPLFSVFYIYLSKKLKLKNDVAFLNKITDIPTLVCFALISVVVLSLIYMNQTWVLIPCLIIAFILFRYKDIPFWRSEKFTIISIFLASVVIFYLTYMYLNKDIMGTHFEYAHFSAFVFPIFKVINGLTLGVDFNSIYGDYPYFYLILSKIFGAWNVDKIVYFNVILLTVSWCAVGFALNKFIKNKLLFLCALILFIFCSGGQGLFYFQGFPLRTINFCFTWFISACILTAKESKKKWLIPLGFAGICAGIVWNSESGFISLIAYTAFLVYCQALKDTVKNKNFYKKSLIYVLQAAVSLLFSLAIYVLIPYFRTGIILPLEQIFWGATLFYKTGYMMIKISVRDAWFIPLLFYFVMLIIALIPVLKFRKSKDNALPFFFLTALIGFGFYGYYQGRSAASVLLSVIFPIPLIAAYFIERLSIVIKIFSHDIKLKPFCQALKIWNMLLCIALFTVALNVFVRVEKQDFFAQEGLWHHHKEFILSLAKEKNLLIIATGSPVFYQMLGKEDIYPFPSSEALFLKQDYDKILTYLEHHNTTVMFTEYWLQQFEKYDNERLNKIISKREKIINPPIVLFRYTGD